MGTIETSSDVVYSNPTRAGIYGKNLLAEEQQPLTNLPAKIDFNSSELLDSWGDSQCRYNEIKQEPDRHNVTKVESADIGERMTKLIPFKGRLLSTMSSPVSLS